MAYQPKPIDTKYIRIPLHLDLVISKLARHAHDTLAQQRIAEGWRYGERRDDMRMVSPDIAPWSELDERAKIAQANAVTAIIKGIIALGFVITPR